MANGQRNFTMEALEDRTVPATMGNLPFPDPTDPRVSQGHQHQVSVDLPQVGPNGALNLGASGDPEARFVQKLYFDLLGRSIDAGAQGYIDGLNNAEISRRDVADSILHSEEYAVRRVDAMFVAFLDRHADQASLDAYLAEIKGGKSLEQVAVDVLSSDECRAMHSTDEDFVVSLFDNVLGRRPDHKALTNYAERLAASPGDLEVVRDIVEEVVTSTEAREMGGEAAVELMLNQPASASLGLSFVHDARDGAAIDAVLADLAASDAYYNLAEIK